MNENQAPGAGTAMTRADYEKVRKAGNDRIRDELERESEAQRQKRLWKEENARKNLEG